MDKAFKISSFFQTASAKQAWQQQLTNKQRIPVLPTLGVKRPYLIQTLAAQPKFWLNAPVGFGKTLALAELARHQQQRQIKVIWLSLAAHDQQAELFLLSLINASAALLGESVQPALEHWQATLARGQVDVEQTLLLWLAGLEPHTQLCIVLDDVQNLGTETSWQLLIRILEMLPAQVQIGLASRFLPAPLGRGQLLTNLTWFGDAALAFNEEETQQLLQTYRITPNTKLLSQLEQFLQGWPAGLTLWLRLFQAAGCPSSLTTEQVEQLALLPLGDYLSGEVLLCLPPKMQEFLRLCAVLGKFNEALLQHCYGSDDYHLCLQEALSRQLFLSSSKQHSGWFEMQPVLAKVLASQVPLARRSAVHRQAFERLSQRTEYAVLALKHALAADIAEQVREWLMQEAEQILANLDFANLLAWFEQLGERWWQQQPRLQAIYCWALLLTQQREQAQFQFMQLTNSQSLQPFELDAIGGYLARLNNDLDGAEKLCKRALEQLPAERFSLRIFMASTLCQLRLARQDIRGAKQYNQQAQDVAHKHQTLSLDALTLYDLARIHFYNGQLEQSRQTINRALQLLQSQEAYAERLPRGRLLIYQAVLNWMSNFDGESCQLLLRQGIALCAEHRDIAISYGYVLQAFICSQQGHTDEALQHIDNLEWLLQRWQVEDGSYHWLVLVRVHVLINHGKTQHAALMFEKFLADRSLSQLPRSEVFPMLPDLARLTQVRLLLQLGRLDECQNAIDKAAQKNGSVIYRALLSMLRALLLHRQHPASGQAVIGAAVRTLHKENIASELIYWLANLHQNSQKITEHTPLLASHLSERELEVLQKIALGLSNQEIADQLFLSLHTVKTHARKINVKLAAKSRTQALAKAQELGLIS